MARDDIISHTAIPKRNNPKIKFTDMVVFFNSSVNTFVSGLIKIKTAIIATAPAKADPVTSSRLAISLYSFYWLINFIEMN